MNDDRPRVAFQGERGAFSELAARKLLGNGIGVVPRPTFEALFRAIAEDAADYVLVPVENTLAGSVKRTYDLLLESSLGIAAEVIVPIAHHLIGCPGSSLRRIKKAASHPVALAQCERFFSAHPEVRRVTAQDTAGSVREVIRRGDPSCAAIAGELAATLYGGKILRRHLEDHRMNYTRFFLLAASAQSPSDADKLSLVFRLPHRPGALYRALRPFALRKINLLRIESRPIHGRPWEYHFYLDVRAPSADPKVPLALRELTKLANHLRCLGHYRAAQPIRSAAKNSRSGSPGA